MQNNRNHKNDPRLRIGLAATIALAATLAHGGDFKLTSTDAKTGAREYHYTGEIVPSDVSKFETILAKTGHVTVTVDSPGGSFVAGLQLGYLAEANSKKLTIVIGQAFSAAAVWALGDDEPQWRDNESALAMHLPFVTDRTGIDSEDDMIVGYMLNEYLEDVVGETAADRLMEGMYAVRKEHGTQGFLVMLPSGKAEVWVPKK